VNIAHDKVVSYLLPVASTLIKAENIGQTICYKVKADTPCAPLTYFPERYLSEWIKKNEGEDVCVYTFERNSAGVKPLVTAYNTLIELLKIDTIILVSCSMRLTIKLFLVYGLYLKNQFY
jgi:hypothetical protein